MSSDLTLRYKVLEAIRAGRLPGHRPEHTWGKRGSSKGCAVCGESSPVEEVEWELEYATGGNDTGQNGYHVHPRCFRTWHFEQQAAESGSVGRLSDSGGDTT